MPAARPLVAVASQYVDPEVDAESQQYGEDERRDEVERAEDEPCERQGSHGGYQQGSEHQQDRPDTPEVHGDGGQQRQDRRRGSSNDLAAEGCDTFGVLHEGAVIAEGSIDRRTARGPTRKGA